MVIHISHSLSSAQSFLFPSVNIISTVKMKNLATLLLSLLPACLAETQISTFSDTACQLSLNLFEGPNGYPDGVCTRLSAKGNYSSFQIISVDAGCTGMHDLRIHVGGVLLTLHSVSIYAQDTTEDVCSGTALVAELTRCYNASLVYYSIDHCDVSAAESASATQSSTLMRISSTTDSFGATTAASKLPTSTPKLPLRSKQGVKNRTGSIVGGVIGGIAILAIVGGVLVYLHRRRQASSHSKAGEHTPRSELGDTEKSWEQQGKGSKIHEMQATEVHKLAELPDSSAWSSKPRDGY